MKRRLNQFIFIDGSDVPFKLFPGGVFFPINALTHSLIYDKLDVTCVVFGTITYGFVKILLLSFHAFQEMTLESSGHYWLGFNAWSEIVFDFSVLDGSLVKTRKSRWYEMPLVLFV